MVKESIICIAVAAACAATLCVSGCGGAQQAAEQPSGQEQAQEEQTPEPLDLTGSWKQVNADGDTYMSATIKGKNITVYWVSDGGDTKSLYWKGSYKAPSDAADSYEWTSKGDTDEMARSLMASTDGTKDFSYANGQLTYEASALGTAKTVRMESEE